MGGVRLADDDDTGPFFCVEKTLHRGKFGGLNIGDLASLQVAAREKLEGAGEQAHDDAERDEDASVFNMLISQEVERAQTSHKEGGRYDRATHGVHVLRVDPGVEQHCPVVGDVELSSRDSVADGMLHPGVGGNDEAAGCPGAEPDHEGGEPVHFLAEGVFSEEEDAQECRLDEEGKGPLHCQRLRDDVAREDGETGPVRAKLELHRNACDSAYNECEGEDSGPEVCAVIETLVFAP